MTADPKITDTLLYGEGLCKEQHTGASFVWGENWVVFGDQLGRFGEPGAKHVAVQFRRRPARARYVERPIMVRTIEPEDA